jgi:hypothetical protein
VAPRATLMPHATRAVRARTPFQKSERGCRGSERRLPRMGNKRKFYPRDRISKSALIRVKLS